jgi:hypothetical protein
VGEVEEVDPVEPVVLVVVPVSEDSAFVAVVPIWDAVDVAAVVAAELIALERMLMTLVLCYTFAVQTRMSIPLPRPIRV